jgi:hypothetical protein
MARKAITLAVRTLLPPLRWKQGATPMKINHLHQQEGSAATATGFIN